ncbi:RDD family protein [Clostridium cylindrosporum]|uniref:RDD domain-containing protein n=1 Tax=Clostridium cylindrosporum DSM 605 TaxID=1121307 RepID=A0A0J8DAQ9_CLOCY|nr:RDD family protein [Clostridium cylindrosporum]KMT22937.1 hypothetical protein CLCY_5c01760 [Clostridium cylindrosporum DSM 605]
MKLIFLSLRAGSYIIDIIFYTACVYILGGLSYYSIILSLLILFTYRIITSCLLGATLGMKVLGLSLSRHDFKTVLKRELYRIASRPFYIGYLFALGGDHSQCLHDKMAGVKIIYISRKKRHDKKPHDKSINDSRLPLKKPSSYMLILTVLLTVLSIGNFTTKFLMNHVGMIGFTKKYTSSEYYNNLDSDLNTIKSQEGLFKSTIGMKFTEVITIGSRDTLIKISPKDSTTEVYMMKPRGKDIIGEYLYTLPYKAEYIDTVSLNGKKLLTYLTKDKKLHIVDSYGNIIHSTDSSLNTPIDLKVGILNGIQSIVVICNNGYAEIFHIGNDITSVYKGKIGEDISPEQFLVDDYLYILTRSNPKLLYKYKFNNSMHFLAKNPISIDSASTFEKINLKGKEYFVLSDVKRANMTFNAGRIQLSKIFTKDGKLKYNLGARRGSLYTYKVNQVENVLDINGDGKDEIIIKSVRKGNVTGDSYTLNVYEPNAFLTVNEVLTKLLKVFNYVI